MFFYILLKVVVSGTRKRLITFLCLLQFSLKHSHFITDTMHFGIDDDDVVSLHVRLKDKVLRL